MKAYWKFLFTLLWSEAVLYPLFTHHTRRGACRSARAPDISPGRVAVALAGRGQGQARTRGRGRRPPPAVRLAEGQAAETAAAGAAAAGGWARRRGGGGGAGSTPCSTRHTASNTCHYPGSVWPTARLPSPSTCAEQHPARRWRPWSVGGGGTDSARLQQTSTTSFTFIAITQNKQKQTNKNQTNRRYTVKMLE